jgi:phage recombination protein Bet
MNTVTQLPAPKTQTPRSVVAELADRYGMDPEEFREAVARTCMPNNTTPAEFLAFLLVAKAHDLNPVLREIYAFPKKGGGIVPIVSIDGWVNLINSQPALDGIEFDYHEDDKGKLTSVTCRIHRKDRRLPIAVTEFLEECERATEPWKMKRRMLRHKALIQCARYAFGFAGIYDEDEAERFAAVAPSRSVEPPPAPRVIEHQPQTVVAERPAPTSTKTAGGALPAQDAGAESVMAAPRSDEAPASDLSTELDDSIFDGDAMLAEARDDFAAAQTARDVVDVMMKYEPDPAERPSQVDRLSRSQQETWNHLCETAMARVNPPQKPVQAQEPPPAPTQSEESPPAPLASYEPAWADLLVVPPRGSITTEAGYEAYIERALDAATSEDAVALKALWKGTQKHRSEDIGLPVARSNALRKRLEAKLDELEGK